jgi:hypothetical protein
MENLFIIKNGLRPISFNSWVNPITLASYFFESNALFENKSFFNLFLSNVKKTKTEKNFIDEIKNFKIVFVHILSKKNFVSKGSTVLILFDLSSIFTQFVVVFTLYVVLKVVINVNCRIFT